MQEQVWPEKKPQNGRIILPPGAVKVKASIIKQMLNHHLLKLDEQEDTLTRSPVLSDGNQVETLGPYFQAYTSNDMYDYYLANITKDG